MDVLHPRPLSTPVLLGLFVNSQAAAEPRVLIPSATGGIATRRYTTDKPGADWTMHDFHEELYDYGSGRSAVQQGAFLVERENVAANPAYQELRQQLGAMMDRSLDARTNVEELKRQTA